MTSLIEKFGKFNRRISSWAEIIAQVALVFIMCVSVVDVIGAKVFLSPVFGSLDVIMIAQWLAMTWAAAMTLIMGQHITVDFFLIMMPRRLRLIVDSIVYFLSFAFFVMVVWYLFQHGYSLQAGGEESMTARIPLYPFVYMGAFACIPVGLVYLQKLMNLMWAQLRTRNTEAYKG